MLRLQLVRVGKEGPVRSPAELTDIPQWRFHGPDYWYDNLGACGIIMKYICNQLVPNPPKTELNKNMFVFLGMYIS